MFELTAIKQAGQFRLNVDLRLPDTGIIAIFGRSGAGKTSLIHLVSGLTQPDEGRVVLGEHVLCDTFQGIDLPPEKRRIGYVFQDARLFPHYKVRGNLLYGGRGKPDPSFFDEVIHLLDIAHLLNRYPSGLSGGEKQRVAIGRALLSRPDMLLMDEPLASLDLPRKQELMPYLESLAKSVKIPMLYVSHSLDEILRLADHMVVLDQGKVVANGPLTDVWGSSVMQPWLSTREQSSILQLRVQGHHPDYPLTELEISPDIPLWVSRVRRSAGESVRVRIHANDVSVTRIKPEQTSIRNVMPARIEGIEQHRYQADVAVIRLRIGCSVLMANITTWALDELNLHVGDSLYAQIKGVSLSQQDLA
ncbi:molybdenum ABC transporter ATP-binding protein ModC [Photobacterium sp. 1_MG-2023]|uniref:molybdenum ABC transporter ATP-binding protein ModC n=1 Tax=Photobacterium sp. 1_MG-2023 TaxID=3062646 RepID=UPI0026E2A4E9|nr:molybdenum ABC transporter ATP-binding protein ModC [Photobacterium sp. 1_MG-2023]MDO6706744.1 molybdenum ABC transporter ATP-binding protein ModC [Photobacterium sp. 1_MG-2023]